MIKRFIVKGDLQGKQRARTVRRFGKVRSYTPKKTADYESYVKECYREQCDNYCFETRPIKVEIVCYRQIPKSFSKKKRQQALANELLPIVKPDIDNIAKCILDGVNHIAYHDDSSIVELNMRKFYGETPMVIVTITDEIDYTMHLYAFPILIN